MHTEYLFPHKVRRIVMMENVKEAKMKWKGVRNKSDLSLSLSLYIYIYTCLHASMHACMQTHICVSVYVQV